METIKLNGANPQKVAEQMKKTIIMHDITNDKIIVA